MGTTLSRILFVAASTAALMCTSVAQTKVGVINMQQAILGTAEIKKASADLEAKYKPQSAELEKIRQDLEALQQKMDAGRDKLTPQAQNDLAGQAQRKQRDFQRKGQDLQEAVDAERNDILSGAGKKMAAVVTKLAEERGLDVVVEASSTLYIKPALDLTKDATAAYDKAYPVR